MPDLVDLDEDDGAPLPERFNELAARLADKHAPQEVRRIVRSLMGVGFNLNLFPNMRCSRGDGACLSSSRARSGCSACTSA
jgi:hypothetical protein